VEHLRRPPHELADVPPPVDDPLVGEDSALALYLLYELHYRSFAGVGDGWEWEPSLLAVRARLERRFLERLFEHVDPTPTPPGDVVPALEELAADDCGPSLSAYMAACGTFDQLREFAIHRSPYQLKEADPHSWVIPRLEGRAKAALVEIQRGEYGSGRAEGVHATLFANTMSALGLDPSYGAYLDSVPGTTLATVNLMSLFGLHRRWRGALVGHLALFEMCSVVPMGRYSTVLKRFGIDAGVAFYDAHVVADEYHEVIALHDMAGALAAEEPDLASDIVFGARALVSVERVFAAALLDAWNEGRSSLRARTDTGVLRCLTP
jgi:hypothetical protein